MHELRHKREKKLRRLVSRHRHQHHISHRRHHITAITPRPSLHHNDHQLPPFHPHTRRLLAALRAGAPPAAPPTISIIAMPRRAALLLGSNPALTTCACPSSSSASREGADEEIISCTLAVAAFTPSPPPRSWTCPVMPR